jgi:ribonuclease III
MSNIDYELLEKKLGYIFKDKSLLKTALTHKTYAFEAETPLEFNERLEFLGDSILNFIVSEQLYKANTYFSEGELTRRRSVGVNNIFLSKIAKQLEIGNFLLLGKGEHKQNGYMNNTNLSNALEAIIAAIYLDSNIKTVGTFIIHKILENKNIY